MMECVGGCPCGRVRRQQADACGDGELAICYGVGLAKQRADLVGDLGAALLVAVGNYYGELVAAEAAVCSGRGYDVGESLSDGDEDGVAHVVTE
jgi:hypothetical protein